MKICAVIPAAGSGSRTGFEQNKVLQKYDGIPVLRRTVSAFAADEQIEKVIVCIRECDRAEISALLSDFKSISLVCGGATRTESVKNALEFLAKEQTLPDYVLIHDAARPFVSPKIIRDCIDTVRAFGSAVCSLPCTDTLVSASGGMVCGKLDRESTYLVQTPQAFSFPLLLAAYRKITPQDVFTDDAGVFAKYIAPPRLFTGERTNIKLTFREDFSMTQFRTGIGIDTHAFGKSGDHITLGGVKIPSESGLLAHSDGDVLVHAVMDALLSAAGLSDIGHYFPDTDPQYKDADSLVLLANVNDLIQKQGLAVGNISAAIVAQKPKLAPYIPQMKQNIAYVLQISERNIGITAGTNEGLGSLGRGEGICVTANVLLRSK